MCYQDHCLILIVLTFNVAIKCATINPGTFGMLSLLNNNYALREKCKKCGQPNEVAAMSAIAMLGASLPTHPHYFSRATGLQEQKINIGFLGNGSLQQSLPLTSSWPLGGADTYGTQTSNKFGVQLTSTWPLGGNLNNGVPYTNQANQLMVQKGWRNGDWICNCGFHNYSSRLQTFGPQQAYPPFEQNASSGVNQAAGMYPPCPGGISAAPNFQVNLQLPQLMVTPALLGKGAKQWRDGDWMCTNCNNHNFASRAQCNRCNTQRETLSEPVSVA